MSRAKSVEAQWLNEADQEQYEADWDAYMGSLRNWHTQTLESAFASGWQAARLNSGSTE